jgi:hypothetical protein
MQALRAFKHMFHASRVTHLVCLGTARPDGRPFCHVQYAKLDTSGVYSACHLAVKRIHLFDEVSFTQSANGRIAGHIGNMVQIDGEHERTRAHPCCRERGFTSGMTCPHYDDIKRIHDC